MAAIDLVVNYVMLRMRQVESREPNHVSSKNHSVYCQERTIHGVRGS